MGKNTEGSNKTFMNLEQYIREISSKTFSARVISLADKPMNVGSIENPDGHGRITGECGDTMEIFIRISGKRIATISFLTDGCGATLACGSAVTELARGKTISDAESVNVLSVLDYLDDLPPSHEHCALLAVKTLHGALRGLK